MHAFFNPDLPVIGRGWSAQASPFSLSPMMASGTAAG